MDSPSIADAVAKATPDVAKLLDQHAKWCAQMCRNVPSPRGEMFRNVPSGDARGAAQTTRMFPNVPESSAMFHRRESGGTNPPVYTAAERAHRPLTYRQLAGARLLVQGRGTLEIAAHLGVEHHTVARWKRNPAFRIELERLRALLTAAAVVPRRAPPAPPPVSVSPARRMTRAEIAREDAECEAMIAQLLAERQGR